MLTRQRKALIMERLRQDGRVVAKSLALEWQLSEDTIRRDLREMAASGLLARVHGGGLPIEPQLPSYDARTQIGTEEKRALGQAAAGLIMAGSLVFIDGGSTNLQLIRALPRHIAFTIVTHSPTIASALEDHANVSIMLIGGQIYRHSMVATGALAMEAISAIRPDLFFLGVTALHARLGLTTGDMEEAAIKRHIAAQAKQTWVLATADKLDSASPVTILPLDAASGVVIPSGLGAQKTGFLHEAGLNIIEA